MKIIDQYKKEVAYLESLSNIENYKRYDDKKTRPIFLLNRTKAFLKSIGNPQRKIKKYIHITGTSGKGSVANFTHEILVAAGKKSGLFTSPFVTETIEKYKIGNYLISPKEFIRIINDLKPSIDRFTQTKYGVPSYFELCFVIAVIYFTKNNCEYIIAEVGCGGEFDATNAVEKNKIAVLTHVDYDHMELLGNTLKKIATTKSKIISNKSVFLTSEKRPELLRIFKKECKAQNALFKKINTDADGSTCIKGKLNFLYEKEKYQLKSLGARQIENAILAINIARQLNIKSNLIYKGIASAKLPARFEIIDTKPTIILDGAHNPDKIASTIDNLGLIDYEKLIVVYASAANKEIKPIINNISKYADILLATKFLVTHRKSVDPYEIYKTAKKIGRCKNMYIYDPWEAFEKAQNIAGRKDVILVTGSFYLAGELRKRWISSDAILRTRKVI